VSRAAGGGAEREAGVVGYIGLGSNLGDRRAHLSAALEGLDAGGARLLRVSSLYETAPYGEYREPQPDFLNAVAEVRTALPAVAVLALCKQIEAERGRSIGGPRHGPRPLDLDVLLLGDEELAVQGLEVPHPRLTERRFVLEPLLELAPKLTLPDGTPLAPALEASRDQEVVPAGSLKGRFHSSGSAAGA
jgi:2-amino-4-hydroxy-6-hydroxymethyldihydropteridine diphosphokinase